MISWQCCGEIETYARPGHQNKLGYVVAMHAGQSLAGSFRTVYLDLVNDMLNAHLPTGSRQLAISPTAD